MLVYVAGSMKEREKIRIVSAKLRAAGYDVFNYWIMPGEETDVKWQEFEQAQGKTYREALVSPHAQNVFEFDKSWLDAAEAIVLVLPAGKSGHLELGYMLGKGKNGYILLDGEPERWDVMYLFATDILYTIEELLEVL
jgi:nucleoside 2-deoxyribosyltransferase